MRVRGELVVLGHKCGVRDGAAVVVCGVVWCGVVVCVVARFVRVCVCTSVGTMRYRYR